MRIVMGSEKRRPEANGGPGPSARHVIPTAVGGGTQVFARALVDELGGARGGHRLTSLFQGQRDMAVDLELDLPGGPGVLSPEQFTLEVGAGTWDGLFGPAGATGAL